MLSGMFQTALLFETVWSTIKHGRGRVSVLKVIIIIPAYNEESNIERVVEQIVTKFPQYDYIIINDCSTDSTEQVCRRLNYNYLSLPVNLGIGGAVQCGYQYAHENKYDIAVQLDGDGQHNPDYLELLIKPLQDNEADLVIGSRFIDKKGFQSSALRRFGINIIRIVIRLCCGVKVTDATSGFRAANIGLIELYSNEYAHDYPEPEAIVTAALNGYRITEMPVVMNERLGGKTSINALRSIYYMLKVPLALIVYRIGNKKQKIAGGART